ncbi:hypothetical protein ANCCAN_28056 [Ancylostoma caninum]|uniref:Uncharacterized protein n=1 Tax=Ancylostoma caninum TaxID=29170 RepID=A0A368F280_ANCCA|nr:hypothetical protein ANCCAN_28056 [Ancylostoma caninum]
MDSLLRDISEADQKKNPNAVVTALRFYAASMKEKEKAKFMTTNSVYNASDEDSDDVEIQLNGQVTGHHAPTPASSSINGLSNVSGSKVAGLSLSSTEDSMSDRAVPSPAPAFNHNSSAGAPTQPKRKESATVEGGLDVPNPPPPIHPRSAGRKDAPPPPPPPQRSKVCLSFIL